MKRINVLLIICLLLFSMFLLPNFTDNISAITQHEASDGIVEGTIVADSADTLYERYNENDDDESYGVYRENWLSQSFTVGNTGDNEDHDIGSIKLKMYRTYSPGILTASIRAVDGNHLPTGSDLSTGTTNGNTLTDNPSGEWREINMSSYELSAGTEYAIVTRCPDAEALTKVRWKMDSAGSTYSGGTLIWSSNSGVSWTDDTDKDFQFEIYGDIAKFNVTRTIIESTEKNNFSFTSSDDWTGDVTLKVPVSTATRGITNVTNNTGYIMATEVNASDDLVNNTFWYDSANQFVHIRTVNLTIATVVNWTINSSYGATFNIIMPSYLEVGDYLFASGLILNSTDIPISGLLATTYILYQNGTDAIDPPHKWNCTNGNYYCIISTTSLPPGIYTVNVVFTDPDSGITFRFGETLYLSSSPEVGVYSNAVLHINWYNTNLGLGLPEETLKLYVDDERQISRTVYSYIGVETKIVVKDYYDFTLSSNNYTIDKSTDFLDLGLTFHEYDFTNVEDEYFYASFLKAGATRWYEKVVSSYGQKNFLLPTGNYTIRVYNADNSSYTSWDETVNSSIAYLIGDGGVTVIIEGRSVIDDPIEWTRTSGVADDSFIIPTKPPVYPEDPFTVMEMYDVMRVTSMPKSDAEITVVFIDTGVTSRVYEGVDLSSISAQKLPVYTSAYDSHGHGTWVSYALASIFKTYLPNARLISFKVFDDEGSCTKAQLIEAFDIVKKMKPDVVSFSGGGYGGPRDDISKKVEELRKEGIIVVVAAGNTGPASGSILSPASSESAICVGSIDPMGTISDRNDDVVTPWSGRGPVSSVENKPDFVAPGESIRGPWIGGSQATISGTSASTPLVAAGIAIMYGNNIDILGFVETLYFWDKQTVPNILEDAMADTAYEKGSVDDYGFGIPDFEKANDAVYGKCLFLIGIWFLAIIIIAVVLILAFWYWWPINWWPNKRKK